MNIIGISSHYHDSAACLLQNGAITSAVEEERLTRIKHDSRLPVAAVEYCLEHAGLTMADVDYVAYYDKPLLKFERILTTYTRTFPRSLMSFVGAMQSWTGDKLWIKHNIRRQLGYTGDIVFGDHHLSHAASSFYASPFDEAAFLTLDGVGEWTTTAYGTGSGLDLNISHEILFPHSIGLLYSAFTSYLGFEPNEGEYKVMGFAAYGKPSYCDQVRRVIALDADGGFHLDMRYFKFEYSLDAYSNALIELFGPPREPESENDERYADIAASVQAVTEEVMVNAAKQVRNQTGMSNLCLAGGVALNCVANRRVLDEAGFDDVFIQPSAGDAGAALGAALYLNHHVLRNPRSWQMTDTYHGPSFSDEDSEVFLQSHAIQYETVAVEDVSAVAASLIADGNVIGWFQGRAEFGPRALGNRSILADPRRNDIKDIINAKIKHRELFRPFAPAVLEDRAAEFFDIDCPSKFMLLVADVRDDKKQLIPAVTHVDGTARLQTVCRDDNPLYYDLISSFEKLSGVPVVLNTSLNVRGEPMVCTPQEAYNCFSHTGLDHLFLGRFLIAAKNKKILFPYPVDHTRKDRAAVIV